MTAFFYFKGEFCQQAALCIHYRLLPAHYEDGQRFPPATNRIEMTDSRRTPICIHVLSLSCLVLSHRTHLANADWDNLSYVFFRVLIRFLAGWNADIFRQTHLSPSHHTVPATLCVNQSLNFKCCFRVRVAAKTTSHVTCWIGEMQSNVSSGCLSQGTESTTAQLFLLFTPACVMSMLGKVFRYVFIWFHETLPVDGMVNNDFPSKAHLATSELWSSRCGNAPPVTVVSFGVCRWL